MRPDWNIKAQDRDITDVIRHHLIELRVEDGVGQSQDSIKFTLSGDRIEMPRTGATLEVFIGYQDNHLVRQGLYKVDELEVSGPPTIMQITAGAADYREKMKEHKSRVWRDHTLGGIVQTIASEHGLKPRVDKKLAAIVLSHIDQTGESDLHFLRRISKDYGALAKPTNGYLVMARRGQGKSVSGNSTNTIILGAKDVSTWRIVITERLRFTAVKARWHDLDSGRDVTVSVGDPSGPIYTLKQAYRDADKARYVARSKLNALRRGKSTLGLTIPGNPAIQAESSIVIADIPIAKGPWQVIKSTHSITGSGFTTELECEQKLPR